MRTTGRDDALEYYGLEKQAILGTLGLGLGLHLAANAGYKLLRKTPMWHGIEENQLAAGFQHGRQGKQLHPLIRNVATYGLGPEFLAAYDMGHVAGANVQEVPREDVRKSVTQLKNVISAFPGSESTPVASGIPGAAAQVTGSRRLSRWTRLPTVPTGTKSTPTQKAISLGLGATAAAIEPHTLLHMGINGVRNALARSSVGKNFMERQLKAGLNKGNLHPAISTATDFIVSPAALDTRRIGAAIREGKEHLTPKFIQTALKSGNSLTGVPTIQKAMDKFLAEHARDIIPTKPRAKAPPPRLRTPRR